MNWFIKRGDPVEVDNPQQIYFEEYYPVSQGNPKSLSINVQCDEISAAAPIHPNKNVRTLVTLTGNLQTISSKDLARTKTRRADNEWCYRILGYVEATYQSASTQYILVLLERRYDTVTAGYV